MFWRIGREKYKKKYQKLSNDSYIKQLNRNLESEIKGQNDKNCPIKTNNQLINNNSPIHNSYSKINEAKKQNNQLEYHKFKNKIIQI